MPHRRGGARSFFLLAIIAALALSLFAIACGDDDGEKTAAEADPVADPDPESGSGAASVRIRVGLSEWKVEPQETSVKAGFIGFLAENNGSEAHELAVVKDGEEIAEIEDIAPGKTGFFTADLKPGKYELACLIQEKEPDGSIEDHYKKGMHIAFEVK